MSLISYLEEIEQIKNKIDEESKEAAIIFIDMTGSTTYKDKRGIRSGVAKVIKFNLDVTKIIKEKGEESKQKGEIEEYQICKYIGDEVMAYFIGESSSKVAVEIAVGIENHFKDVNSEISDEFEKYKAKIGVDFGRVMFADYKNLPPDPQGLIVDRAARIVSLAKPCQILISEEAKNDAGDKVDVVFSEKEKKKVHGIEEKTIVREVVWDEEIGELGMELAVCGTYKVDGKNLLKEPNVPYSGLLQIEEQGEQLFEATWIIGTGAKDFDPSMESNKGIGLRVGNAIAFRYEHTGKDGTYTGVVLYEIMSDNLMSGQWTRTDKLKVSPEKCEKQ
jgi:class 3 adenylate cyclase